LISCTAILSAEEGCKEPISKLEVVVISFATQSLAQRRRYKAEESLRRYRITALQTYCGRGDIRLSISQNILIFG
jgi:hypothetical protein